MKILVRCAVAVMFAWSVVACRPSRPVAHAAGVRLEVSDSIVALGRVDTFSLGRMKQGETILKEFALHNVGNKPFVLNSVKSDCGCLVSEYDSSPVMPDGVATVSISFDSRGYYGFVFKRIQIFTSLTPQPLNIWLQAIVE